VGKNNKQSVHNLFVPSLLIVRLFLVFSVCMLRVEEVAGIVLVLLYIDGLVDTTPLG